jgi:hypothetical protein
LDGDHCKSTTFSTFIRTFAITTTIDIRKSTSYWITNRGSGTTTLI